MKNTAICLDPGNEFIDTVIQEIEIFPDPVAIRVIFAQEFAILTVYIPGIELDAPGDLFTNTLPLVVVSVAGPESTGMQCDLRQAIHSVVLITPFAIRQGIACRIPGDGYVSPAFQTAAEVFITVADFA
jgi:hypothetical protein